MDGMFDGCKNLTFGNIIMTGCAAKTKEMIKDAFNRRAIED